MKKLISKKIFVILFAILYIAVALVSTLHAISFFGLANASALAVLLAITFEIGQAAVLFSILTNNGGKRKILPWILMGVLTLVQILGNVYSSYKFLIVNSTENLRFFREPIFVWTEMPDAACNVILTYIVGAILPIVSLCMTAMVTNYIGDETSLDVTENESNDETINYIKKDSNVTEPILETSRNENIASPENINKVESLKPRHSRFINMKKEEK